VTATTLPEALRQAARVHSTRTAVADSDRRLTFAELHEGVQTTARALVSLGVRPGDRVCLWAPNSWQWVVTALATTYVGAALVPLNSRYTGHEAVDVVRRTRARVVVLADGFLGRSQLDELRSAAPGVSAGAVRRSQASPAPPGAAHAAAGVRRPRDRWMT
jgi:acyl-CoA synthetase (AMP-forming)/AMP-acid ligase II